MTSSFYQDEKKKIEGISSMEEWDKEYKGLRNSVNEHPIESGMVVDMDEYNHYQDMLALIEGPLQNKYWELKYKESVIGGN